MLGNVSPTMHQHQYAGQSGSKRMEFNPNDFHVMSIGEPSNHMQVRTDWLLKV